MAAAGIRVEPTGQISMATIDRPGVPSAIDRGPAVSIAPAMDELDERDDLGVGILTASNHGFSARMALKALAATGERPTDAKRWSRT